MRPRLHHLSRSREILSTGYLPEKIFSSRIEKLTTELDEAKKNLQEKEESEKQLKGMDLSNSLFSIFNWLFSLETTKKLEKSAVHYEKECLSLKSLYEDAEEQIRSTKVALENSYK